jgi:hypothetical protein
MGRSFLQVGAFSFVTEVKDCSFDHAGIKIVSQSCKLLSLLLSWVVQRASWNFPFALPSLLPLLSLLMSFGHCHQYTAVLSIL